MNIKDIKEISDILGNLFVVAEKGKKTATTCGKNILRLQTLLALRIPLLLCVFWTVLEFKTRWNCEIQKQREK